MRGLESHFAINPPARADELNPRSLIDGIYASLRKLRPSEVSRVTYFAPRRPSRSRKFFRNNRAEKLQAGRFYIFLRYKNIYLQLFVRTRQRIITILRHFSRGYGRCAE